ncbi:hypothetical protein D3C87_1579110 [compost metagenome]
MGNHIEARYDNGDRDVKWISNPTNGAENFADRWALPGSNREQFFYDWLERLKEDFDCLGDNFNRMNLNESLKKSFGEASVTKTFSDIGNRSRMLTEAGENYADRKSGIIGAVGATLSSASKVKSHNFHGKE